METTCKPLLELTAADVMTRKVVRIPEDMPVRDAVRLLLQNQIGGAPVVDSTGRCVGVFSAIDFLRMAGKHREGLEPKAEAQPLSCPFQLREISPEGREIVYCLLPPGVCPIQAEEPGPDGESRLICTQPHCVLADWQIVEVEQLPIDGVQQFMSHHPIMTSSVTPIASLAQQMIDAHIHRLIVVDANRHPVGIVATTDILAALARAGKELQRAHGPANPPHSPRLRGEEVGR